MPKKSTDVQQALPNMQRALQQRAPGTESVERETGFEPATSTLARSHSTTELLPLSSPIINEASERGKINAITTGKARGTRSPLPFASGEFGGMMRETLGESQQINDSLEVSFIELAVAGDVTGNFDIRACIERGQQVEFLEYKPNFALPHTGPFRIRELRDILPVNHDAPPIRASQPSQQIEERGLPTPGRPNHADKFRPFHADRHTT